MKAILFKAGADLTNQWAATQVEQPVPEAHGRDVLVRVDAVGFNPVDAKMRPDADEPDAVLGYDAAGEVVAVGEEVEQVAVGDQVYYAGDIRRPGSNAEFHLVDERIVASRPATMDAAGAAALPLTALTAWEALFERLALDPGGRDAGRSLLIIGGAGGVGSIAIQLARWGGLRVIATASRAESAAWCREMGAAAVVNHRDPLRPQLEQLGLDHVDFIANFNNTSAYWDTMGDIIAPQGRIVLIVEPSGPLDFGNPYKSKSVAVSWEFMFTRSMYGTADMGHQREILHRIAALVDAGILRGTLAGPVGRITPENILAIHRQLESGKSIGKSVLAGW